MNCRDTLLMLSGYMDGEIDLVHRVEIERHLETCPECANNLHNGRAVQTVLQSKPLYNPAPAGLESKVLEAVRAAERAQKPPTRSVRRLVFGIAACASLLLILLFAFAHVSRANRETAVIQQATCSHVHSLMANHLLDIASADGNVVKPWFNGKLDYAPSVVDLKAEGYALQGGRLDYFVDRGVAALVYMREKHVINLFQWPTTEPSLEKIKHDSRHGYHLCRWTSGSMAYCAVSDLSEEELARFAGIYRAHTSIEALENCR